MPATPVWLRGPVSGVPPLLQPVAHALLEAKEDVDALLAGLPPALLWERPHGAASIGFHIVHAAGSIDRLFTYARGSALDPAQMATIVAERTLDATFGDAGRVGERFGAVVAAALTQLRSTGEHTLSEPREVGRGKLPSTVFGLLAHAGEHTSRHVGQAITTARILGAAR
jgi:uncharacterized damage-inducible protein DinB